jgi:hypothetical protein
MGISLYPFFYKQQWLYGVKVMMSNAIFNNISVILCRSLLLVEETGVPAEIHQPPTNHCQALLHNVVSSTPRHERDSTTQL